MEQTIGLLKEVQADDSLSSISEDGNRSSRSIERLSLSSYVEEKFCVDSQLHTVRKWQYRVIGLGLGTLLVVFVIGLVGTIIPIKEASINPGLLVNMGSCGKTAQEAQDNGCVFDLMMSGWVQPPCYDKALSDQFLLRGNFTFYTEREAINVLPEAEARLGKYDFLYTYGTYHYQHCAYIFAKQVRANKRSPLVLDNKSRSKEHVEHCWKLLGNPNITQLVLSTGTKIQGSPFKLQCISGDVDLA